MSKVKKFEELSPAEINRDIKKVFNIINKPNNPGMRHIGTSGKQVVIGGRSGYINRIKDGYVYVEMLDNPGQIEQFELKKALKSYKPEKQKDILANTTITGPANASVSKEPKEDKKVVGLEMEKFNKEFEKAFGKVEEKDHNRINEEFEKLFIEDLWSDNEYFKKKFIKIDKSLDDYNLRLTNVENRLTNIIKKNNLSE